MFDFIDLFRASVYLGFILWLVYLFFTPEGKSLRKLRAKIVKEQENEKMKKIKERKRKEKMEKRKKRYEKLLSRSG